MKNKRSSNKGNAERRYLLAREAARLMYEDGIKQFHTAKLKAAKKLLHGRGLRACDLPSNGEISKASHELALLQEGDSLGARLFEMRITALEVMEKLKIFRPRLMGSVSTGKIKKTSDIDLHVFCDEPERLEKHLDQLDYSYEKEQVNIIYEGKPREFTHIYFQREFPVELSVYPEKEIRVRGRSSTDGQVIIRLSEAKLLELIEREHTFAWNQYLNSV